MSLRFPWSIWKVQRWDRCLRQAEPKKVQSFWFHYPIGPERLSTWCRGWWFREFSCHTLGRSDDPKTGNSSWNWSEFANKGVCNRKLTQCRHTQSQSLPNRFCTPLELSFWHAGDRVPKKRATSSKSCCFAPNSRSKPPRQPNNLFLNLKLGPLWFCLAQFWSTLHSKREGSQIFAHSCILLLFGQKREFPKFDLQSGIVQQNPFVLILPQQPINQ